MAKDSKYSILDDYLDNLSQPPRTFEKREIVKGTIISLTKGQMLVDVGGRCEAVVQGKELKLDGEKLNKKVGDEVLVYIIKPENDKGQIEASIRRTGTARKWHDLVHAKENSEPVVVKVIEANTGGVIVEIKGGLRGFVPSSQLNNERIYPTGGYSDKKEATKQLQSRLAEMIDDELEVMVMEIDREKNRVILSEKYVDNQEDMEMRRETLEQINEGSKLEGEVTGIAPFGLFVTAQGLEGLVHLSEISWDKVSNPADFYAVGDTVKVQVIGIEDGGKRIAYSIKRLLPDPWDDIVKNYKIGQVIKGTVTKVVDYGAFVRVDEGLNGLIHISEMSDNLVKDPNEIVKKDEDIDVKIISMSREERHLGLSIRQLNDSGATDKKDSDDSSLEAAPEMARLEEILNEKASA